MADQNELNPATGSTDSQHPGIPTDFFTFKTLRTLAGSAGAVWVTCLVISSLLPKNALTYLHWRYIAFALSEFIVVAIFLKTKRRGLIDWMIAILNGFLVFINASGINSMSAGSDFSSGSLSDSTTKKSSLLPFTKEIAWWPDKELLKRANKTKRIPVADTIISKNELTRLQTLLFKCDSLFIISNKVIVDTSSMNNVVEGSSGTVLTFNVKDRVKSGYFSIEVKPEGDFHSIQNIDYKPNGIDVGDQETKTNDYGNAFFMEWKSRTMPTTITMIVGFKDGTRRRLLLNLSTGKFLN